MIQQLVKKLPVFLNEDDGPTAVEYAIMLSFIVGACILAVGQVATATKNSFNSSGTAVNSALSS